MTGAFVYDLVTITTPTMLTGASFVVALASLVPAVPFMLAHEISDFAFFAVLGPVLAGAILRVVRPAAQRQMVGVRNIRPRPQTDEEL